MKMAWNLIILISTVFFIAGQSNAGSFLGELVLYPDGCQKTNSRKCKLGSELTYKSSRGEKLVWQTDKWVGDEHQSGTTNGASIPKWAWSIIGDPYDPAYLKAAIVHDHYCYKENRVRSWKDTHIMFYDALVDLNVPATKAKTMFFAVYLFGPHWIELVPGENCGENCIKSLSTNWNQPMPSAFSAPEYNVKSRKYLRWEGDRINTDKAQEKIYQFKKHIESSPEMTITEIQEYAKKIEPEFFFFTHGDTYKPSGPKDSNIFSQM
jgi:hypothetical protein